MHTPRILRSAASLLAVWSSLQLSAASPVELNEAELQKRCDNPCGFYSQLCCTSSQTCSTNSNGQAVCVDGSGSGSGSGGQWEYYTTTYIVTETDTSTVTSVWSSYISEPTGSGSGSGSCKSEIGETKCGDECCGPAYVCSSENKCVLGSSSIWATATPPVRGTSASTVTATAAVTTTQGFEAPVGTDGATLIGVHAEGGGLSGGAIAGIVIGTIAGAFLLLLLCACLCCKGVLDALFACLGIGKRKRKETTYVEDRYSHHSHSRPEGRTWFGARPPASEVAGEKKSKWNSLATIGIILGALALCLGLKRRRDHDEKSESSYPSSYYYYSDYYTNPSSSESSGRRTRYTRRSRRSGTRSRRS
ncbi:predicted protein [Aspergillus terreus NIH2624]|uniref:Mid2 domain-containing protein n=1 Tax=Aspergillus terreus (strain NIH 2624 / FGSC A1156) TaxID=341663 RepID=Q0CT60_ASPTN|nr:uncharacterized protein ATEG_03124 [Aspergillus terreus NIH2624]EAU36398.1 predicted protein [Aspergillus terreus NIH2624]